MKKKIAIFVAFSFAFVIFLASNNSHSDGSVELKVPNEFTSYISYSETYTDGRGWVHAKMKNTSKRTITCAWVAVAIGKLKGQSVTFRIKAKIPSGKILLEKEDTTTLVFDFRSRFGESGDAVFQRVQTYHASECRFVED
jgi:hypothetical protein